ncbi:MAG: isoprenylcysteine carboxylmethyltransferase family protein [bacterium]
MTLNRIRLYTMRGCAVLYFIIFYHIRKDVPAPAFFAGTALVILGELVRLLANSVIRKDSLLASSGPYAAVRHPLYLGSFLIYLGFLCFHVTGKFYSAVAVFWLIVTAATIIMYKKKIAGEEKLMAELFPRYPEYRKTTPALFPNPFQMKKAGFKIIFNFKQIVKNREHKLLAGLVVMLIVIAGGIFYY